MKSTLHDINSLNAMDEIGPEYPQQLEMGLQAELEDMEDLVVVGDELAPRPALDAVDETTTVQLHAVEVAGVDMSSSQDQPINGTNETKTFLPGAATIFCKTQGCSHNNSDGEYMAGLLAAQGYRIVLEEARKHEADLWLLNSCTVKGPSEQTFLNDIQAGQAAGKRVVVAGCVPQADRRPDSPWSKLSVIGVQAIDQVVHVVEQTLQDNVVSLYREARVPVEEGIAHASALGKHEVDAQPMRKAGGARLDMPKVRRNPFIEIIPINTGCLNQCTYCKTKHARGDLGSYHPDEIVARLNVVLHEGVREIWLTSEDTGTYGRDIGTSIVELLERLLAAMDAHPVQDAMLRVGMTNPPYILEHIERMGKLLLHPKVYAFLHGVCACVLFVVFTICVYNLIALSKNNDSTGSIRV
jgi:threonylcarbamoyladenosine tRNA methylthiotransferase CDKAL1